LSKPFLEVLTWCKVQAGGIVDPVEYWLDSGNRIIRVNDEWDAFALQNDAEFLLRDQVLGRPLVDFIHDPATREFVLMLVDRSRANGSFGPYRYRCDSPGCRRYLEMEIELLSDETVRVAHRIRKVKLEATERRMRAESSTRAMPRCSQCNRVAVAGIWQDPFDVPTLGDGETLVVYCVCDDCKAAVGDTLVRMRASRAL